MSTFTYNCVYAWGQQLADEEYKKLIIVQINNDLNIVGVKAFREVDLVEPLNYSNQTERIN